MVNKVVRFQKELDRQKSKKAKAAPRQRKKSDLLVEQFCKEHPLDLPQGVEVHRLFFDKGEAMPPEMEALFSNGLARKGLANMKSILYGHVLGKPHGMTRREMFSHKSDSEIYGMKDDIVGLISDPFWKKIESQQKFGSYDWHGYESMIPNINGQYARHNDTDVPWWLIKGIEAAVDELGDGIEPIPLEEAISYCRTDTNAGFPTFSSKPFVKVLDDGSSYEILNKEVYDTYYHISKEVWNGRGEP